jgi:hypothetical protein
VTRLRKILKRLEERCKYFFKSIRTIFVASSVSSSSNLVGEGTIFDNTQSDDDYFSFVIEVYLEEKVFVIEK